MIFDRYMPRRIVLGYLFLLGAFASQLVAQSGGVDPTFNPVPSNPLPSDINFQQIIQPDGKIIVYNAPTMFVNGELRSGMFRLNVDGTTDTSFSYNNEGGVGIHNVMIAPDGKIVLAGSTSPNHAKMVRLNPDGSLDNAFSVLITAVGPPEFTGNWLAVNAVQPDGKVIATHGSWGNIAGTWYSYSMRRYNLDGSIDSSFAAPALDGGHLVSTSTLIATLPDGRFYLAISTGNHLGRSMTLSRRLADGTVDSTYTQFTRSISGGFFINFTDLAVTPDGGVLATGLFWPSMVGGPYPQNLFRFLPAGGFDPTFASPAVSSGNGVHLLPDGKVLYSAALSRPLVRLLATGAVDDTYVLDPVVTAFKNTWQVDPMNRPVFLAHTAAGPRLVRLLENGSIDPSFNPILGAVGTASLLAAQPDGKVLVVGSFTHMNGVARRRFARVNADGSLDPTFDPGTGFNSDPRTIVVQPDGKILAAGSFNDYNGTPVSRMVRLNSNGSLDNSFSVTFVGSPVVAVALQSDGKIVVGGSFSTVNGVNRTRIARLESNGALDSTFDTLLSDSSTSFGVNTIVLESNGRITFGGRFNTVNGVSRTNLARVDSTGATDTTFNAGGLPDTFRLWQQADGKYVFVGSNPGLARRNNDGSPDPTFNPPTFTHPSGSAFIETVLLRPDGSMLVGGSFGSVGGTPRWYITRLRPNGAHDASFLSSGANATVYSIVPSGSDKAVIAGNFNAVENTSRLGIARLTVPELQGNTRFDFDGDGKADIAVYRPSSGVWYQLLSSGNPNSSPVFGLAGDIPVPADYDGDGKTDLAIFRPSSGDWWYRASSDGSLRSTHWGTTGDIPLPADINNDGKDDFVVFRPSNNYWYRITTTGVADEKAFGLAGDKPVIGDFDGDGKTDQAIFRPSTGDWWYSASSAGGAFRATHWGQNGDIPAPADFDGDGKTDLAVFRPSNGAWYVQKSSDLSFIIKGFGISEDRPIPADYDGDGLADIAVFRPSTGVWYVMHSTSGTAGYQWGVSTDVAVPNAFIQ